MPKASAGILMFRIRSGVLECLLVHPGGPFWTKKDTWFLPKGEIEPDEDPFTAAKREFREETGITPEGTFIALGSIKHKRTGKEVFAWALEGDCEPSLVKSNTFQMEWPPKSGQQQEFPEIDRAEFFSLDRAKEKAHPDEYQLLVRLAAQRKES